jgi:ATP-dependent protease ClpP protease subunit
MTRTTLVQVDDNSADAIISQLLLLNASDSTSDIKFFINSPGGSVTAGKPMLWSHPSHVPQPA